MPPCIVYTPRIRLTASWFTRTPSLRGKRLFVSVSSPESPRDTRLLHRGTLTALHRANAILPNVLPPAKVAIWRKLLSTSSDILSGVTTRKPRIAVLGLDELSQSHEVVSALLDDPLSSDQRNIDALKSRNRQRRFPHDLITLSYGELDSSNTHLRLDLPWLKKMNVEIVEIPSGHPDTITLLYDADVQILVTSPLAVPLDLDFQPLLSKPGLFLILNYPTFDQQVLDHTLSRLTHRFPALSGTLIPKVLHAYPSRALSALDIFRQRSTSAADVQIFQDGFLDSGVIGLSQSVSKALSLDHVSRRSRYAQFVLTGVLQACRNAAQHASQEAAAVQKSLEELRSRVHKSEAASVQDILGGSDASEVRKSVERSRRQMQIVMDALPWWKLPFKVDDLGEMLSLAAERVWCPDLQAKLQFQTGRLSSLRSTLTSETLTILHLLPTSFQSAVLVNILHQLSARPPELGPTTLTYPLWYRLQQLQHPITALHRRAQRTLLTTIVTTFLSIGGAYSAWFLGSITPPTAVGLGVLGTVAGLRWLVGRWKKEKTRWWENWGRVGEGLERDIEETLSLILKEKISAVPSKAVEELEKAAAKRLRELESLDRELEDIESNSHKTHPDQDISGE